MSQGTWRQVAEPGEAHFENRYAATTAVAVTAPGTYVFELVCSDGAHRVRSSVQVTSQAPAAGVFETSSPSPAN